MELRNYIIIFRRRKWAILITTAVTLLIVGMATLMMTPVYSSSATVRIAQLQDRSVDYFDLNYSTRLINTYVELVRGRPFIEETIQRLGLATNPEDLAESIHAESVPNTELLKITAESSNPSVATSIANTLGQLLVEEGVKLYSGQGMSAREILSGQLLAIESELAADREQLQALPSDETGETLSPQAQDLQVRILIQEQMYRTVLDAYENARLSDAARANSAALVEPATIPENPARPNAPLNLVLGAIVGLASGIGLAFLLDNLDLAIYSPSTIEKESQPLLGSIPNLRLPSNLRGSPLLLQPNGRSSATESFRILRSNVLTMDHGRPPRSLLVTSVEERAGKSTVLANLALAFGQVGKKVVAVDADLREPALNRVFNVPNGTGLKNAIVQGESIQSVIQKTSVAGVSVITSGPLPHKPAELLGLPSLQMFVSDLVNWADLVIIDSPPMARYSDAVVLAPLVDTVLLVVGRGKVSKAQVHQAVTQLTNVGAGQIGLVFNRAE